MNVVPMVSVSVTESVRNNLCHLAEIVYDDPFGLYRLHEQIRIGLADDSGTVEILE